MITKPHLLPCQELYADFSRRKNAVSICEMNGDEIQTHKKTWGWKKPLEMSSLTAAQSRAGSGTCSSEARKPPQGGFKMCRFPAALIGTLWIPFPEWRTHWSSLQSGSEEMGYHGTSPRSLHALTLLAFCLQTGKRLDFQFV